MLELNKLAKRNHFYKSLILIGCVFILSILIVFFLVITKFEDTANKIVEDYNLSNFSSLVERENTIDENAVNMILGLNQTPNIATLKFTIYDEEEIHKAVQNVNLMLKYNIDALESCYVCNFTNNRIYLLGNRSGYYNKQNFFDQGIIDILFNGEKNFSLIDAPISRTFVDENGKSKDVYTYILIDNFDQENKPIDALVLNISIDEAYGDLIKKDDRMLIYDQNDKLLRQYGDIPSSAFDLNFIKDSTTLSRTWRYEGTDYLVTFAKLKQNKWSIVSFSPLDILTDSIKTTKQILFIILIVILLFALLSSYTISNYLYRPIKKLIQKIPIKSADEFTSIQDYIQNKEEEIERISDKLAENQPYAKLRFLSNLLKSSIDEEELTDKVKTLNFNIPLTGKIGIIKVKLDDKPSFLETFSSLKQMNCRNSLLKEVLESLSDYDCEYHYTNDYSNFIVVVSLPLELETSLIRNLVSEKLEMVQKQFKNFTGFSISILLSNLVEKLNDIHLAFNNLELIEDESFFTSPAKIFTTLDIKERNLIDFPNLQIDEINKAILAQNKEDFTKAIDKIFDIISKTDKDSAVYYIRSIHYAIFSAVKTYQSSSMNAISLDGSDSLEVIQDLSFLNDIKDELLDIGLQIIDLISDNRSDNKNQIISKMQEFIKDNYKNKNLTSALIADKFKLSNAYANKLFKTSTGDSLLNAINNYRIEKAAELLKNTRLTVEEITEEIGWDNLKHFYSKFKSYYGITPKEWRMR